MIFFHPHKNYPQKGFSHWISTESKIWAENSISAIKHIRNRKKFLEWFPPLIKLILLDSVVVLQYTNHIQMTCLIIGGRRMSSAQKQTFINAH